MEDELDLDSLESNAEQKLKVKNRFEQLSEKVILTSKERDEAIAKAKAEEEAKSVLEKERDFYKDYSVNVAKYPHAAEHQDQIWEKVKGGYTTEDAIVAVLNKEGKLAAPSPEPNQPTMQAEGGSAATAIPGGKTPDTMSAEEKFAALQSLNNDQIVGALRGK